MALSYIKLSHRRTRLLPRALTAAVEKKRSRIPSRQPYLVTFYLACDKFVYSRRERRGIWNGMLSAFGALTLSPSIAHSCPSCDTETKKFLRKRTLFWRFYDWRWWWNCFILRNSSSAVTQLRVKRPVIWLVGERAPRTAVVGKQWGIPAQR